MKLLIIGTGLIGASIGLALKSLEDLSCEILAWDASAEELHTAQRIRAIDHALESRDAVAHRATAVDVVLLATPVLPIMDWMERLAPSLSQHQLVTDVGSTKREIVNLARTLFNQPARARFLPGHPMAGKESGGATLAEPTLFRDATWLFTPCDDLPSELEREWRKLVERFGARVTDLDAVRHDEVCAWVSHLPQMLSTALAALLQDTFTDDAERIAAVQAIGGRALRETTRLGASPYSMWRDVALTNTEPIAASLLAFEQHLQHIRENLRTPQLREEFAKANLFRKQREQRQQP